jgi:hypothetical protein
VDDLHVLVAALRQPLAKSFAVALLTATAMAPAAVADEDPWPPGPPPCPDCLCKLSPCTDTTAGDDWPADPDAVDVDEGEDSGLLEARPGRWGRPRYFYCWAMWHWGSC